MIVNPATAPNSVQNGLHTVHLSVAGGLRQFGAYLDTLQPGAWSSHRHWLEAEDEFLYVLSGTATLRDDDGEHTLHPGDAACWRHGDPNAHHVTNRGDAPCRWLIVGTRVEGDICHYPDSGERQINLSKTWQVVSADGQVLRGGDLPPELLNLPPVWGTPFTATDPTARIQREAVGGWQDEPDAGHPILGPGPGLYRTRLLSDPGGLSQFGAFLEELPPGSSSGRRHWHDAEDEMILMLEGEAVLVEEAEATLHPGDVACWPAGHPVGHRLDNRSDRPVRYLVVGTRLARDRVHYTDHDLVTEKDGTARRYLHRDGTPYPTGAHP